MIEIKVPDIGNFDSVDVIDVLVKVGDTIAKEDSLITVESDKASMDIPAPQAGVVKELKIKVGDKVAKDSLILLLETDGVKNDAPEALQNKASSPVAEKIAEKAVENPVTAPIPAVATSGNDISTEVVVLGSGPGGYTAAFRAADLGKKVVVLKRRLYSFQSVIAHCKSDYRSPRNCAPRRVFWCAKSGFRYLAQLESQRCSGQTHWRLGGDG